MIARLTAAWRRLRSHFWLALAFDVAVICAIFLAVHAWQTRSLPVDAAAPVTHLAQLDGSGFRNAVESGESGIVYFFAPWCRVCRLSIGNLDDLVERGSVGWATVVALDFADPAEVQEFIDRTGVSLPVVLGDSQTARDWAIAAFPTYYVIDADGLIHSRAVGYSTWLGMWARHFLAN